MNRRTPRRWLFACLALAPAASAFGQSYRVSTLAGRPPGPSSLDGTGPGARFSRPYGVAVDGSGNAYVADTENHTVRRVAPGGEVTTLAGLAGTYGSADGLGGAARFFHPTGIAVDASGNVYVADEYNHAIRKVSAAGEVTTLAGLPSTWGSADGLGSDARFYYPAGVAVDAFGNVYVGDSGNRTIRRITPAGEVTTLAGLAGASGSADGIGSAARFWRPRGVAVDASGNVYVADAWNGTIRKVTAAGEVTTLAGLAGVSGSDDGNGSAARFWQPEGVAVDALGNAYVADTLNNTIRKITAAGNVTTFAGLAGWEGSVDAQGAGARFRNPRGTALDALGNLYLADTENGTVRKLTTSADVSTLAGAAAFGGTDGAGGAALFYSPSGVALDAGRNAYVADGGNRTVRKVTPAGDVTTLAGFAGAPPGGVDGPGSAARFFHPSGVAVDGSGNVYVADSYAHTIRKVTPAGDVTTLAGLYATPGRADGTGVQARFNWPHGVAVDSSGTVYVGDTGNHAIRKVSPSGVVTTFVDGIGHVERFTYPQQIAVDGSGKVYAVSADPYNSRVWRATPAGELTALAGALGPAGAADGTGSDARFSSPSGVAVDDSGNVYVADSLNHTIRKVTSSGVVTTLAGIAGVPGFVDALGSAARFKYPTGVAVDGSGSVFVADTNNNVVRRVTPVFPLVVAKAGVAGGTVTSSPPGVSCGTDCAEDYDGGTLVALAATARSQFDGWTGGGCSGTGTCTVTMDAAKSVTASFAWRPAFETVCATGCTRTRIQDAIDASQPGDTVLVRSSYDSLAAGEVFPIQTAAIRAISSAGVIRILGETDASGNPVTAVSLKGPADGLVMSSPGFVENLRILPGNAARIERVVVAASGAPCPGPSCHLKGGLTIRNVVIDFSTTFSAGDGLHLLADDVLIEKVTLKGMLGKSIFVDGDNATIRDSTLDGRGGATIRGALAIGFGADQKAGAAACKGVPHDYVITGNTITGYADGIQWCSGQDVAVLNNALTDISGRAIDTSGSVRTQILSNVLTQKTTGGVHGIGFSNNAYQTCVGNKIALNKVIGRAARDLGRGITAQGCADTEVLLNEVRDTAVNGGSIVVSMSPGQSTRTLIQGNTVIGGNGVGIVYLGSDTGATAADRSVIRDNVVTDHDRDGIVVRYMKGPRSGIGAGNLVAYNTVRKANQGNLANTHGISLQSLAGTAFDRNTALDTRGAAGVRGYGFFLADSAGVNGNCNTGAANAGGLFGQANVTPPYGNVNVNCRLALYTHYDFDGDGRSDTAVYRHSTGEWLIRNSSGVSDTLVAWGTPALDDIPAPGSYTQAGKTDVAVYRFTTGDWIIRRSTDGGTSTIRFGEPFVGDVPVPADYDGDGLSDLATFRVSTANAEWRIRRSSDGLTQYFAWGCAACADLAVPADYDGDGKADVAVYRRATGEWYVRRSSDGSLLQVSWGSPELGDLPVPGRYTTPSRADIAVYRSLTGQWLIRRATDAGLTAVAYGDPAAGDFPVPADFTANGITDVAVYRSQNGAFLIRRSDGGTTSFVLGNPALLDAPLTSR